MKKALLTLTISIILFTCANAQIKLHQSGQVSLGTTLDSRDSGVQVMPNGGCVYFNNSDTSQTWPWVTIAAPSAKNGKCWIVSAPNNKYDHKFFVTADGLVWMDGAFRSSDSGQQSDVEPIEGAGSVLDALSGIWYTPAEETGSKTKGKRRAGVTAQEVQKVLPEAVITDENGKLFVDYDTFTVFLIEAIKEQRKEIETLRNALKNNGLLK